MSKSISRRTFLQTSGVTLGASALHSAAAIENTLNPSLVLNDVTGVTQQLAHYLVKSRWENVPKDARKEAVRSVFNWVGCSLGGAHHVTTDRAMSALAEFTGKPEATVLGRVERLDIQHAALMNGITSHVLDYDDTHLETIIHPAGPVASAILSLGERNKISGKDFMHAFILGVEAECRIGKAVYPSHYERGYHITGTAGVFGAAAASGKLLGLSEQQMVWAIGIASTQSAGLKEMFGTMCKPFHPGRAAQNGLTSAFLASKNFTSTERGIEAPQGFAFTMSDEQDFSQITNDLGNSFEVTRNTYRPFACGIVTHPAIDGCIQLRNNNDLKSSDIASVTLRVNSLVLKLTGKTKPRTGLEAKFSIYHACSVAIIYGSAGPKEYTDKTANDLEVVSLRDRVTAKADESVSEEEAFVSITLRDGTVLKKHIEHAIGSLERPMTNEALEKKFRDQAENVLPPVLLNQVIEKCWDIETTNDINSITRVAVPR